MVVLNESMVGVPSPHRERREQERGRQSERERKRKQGNRESHSSQPIPAVAWRDRVWVFLVPLLSH